MENIRWILLLIGVLLIVGIYVFSRLQSRETAPRQHSRRTGRLRNKSTPDLAADGFDDLMDAELDQMGRQITAAGGVQQPGNVSEFNQPDEQAAAGDAVFSLFVIAPARVPFPGPILLGAFAAADMAFGDMQIFHRVEQVDGQEKILFSAANIREPGIFDLSAMDTFTSEGIALFMQVPGAVDAGYAFDAMTASATSLADSLNGQVCDANRSVLTQQTIRHMREEVIGCQLQHQVAKTAS